MLRRYHTLSSGSDYYASKLAPRFDGPYVVSKVLSTVVYEIAEINTGKKVGRYHISDLKPYFDPVLIDLNVSDTLNESNDTVTEPDGTPARPVPPDVPDHPADRHLEPPVSASDTPDGCQPLPTPRPSVPGRTTSQSAGRDSHVGHTEVGTTPRRTTGSSEPPEPTRQVAHATRRGRGRPPIRRLAVARLPVLPSTVPHQAGKRTHRYGG